MRVLFFLLLSLLLVFYVGWPAWSGYRIYDALEKNDAATLERKVDFPSVRDSLMPAIRAEVDKTLERTMGDAAGKLRDGRLRQEIGPQLMETDTTKDDGDSSGLESRSRRLSPDSQILRFHNCATEISSRSLSRLG